MLCCVHVYTRISPHSSHVVLSRRLVSSSWNQFDCLCWMVFHFDAWWAMYTVLCFYLSYSLPMCMSIEHVCVKRNHNHMVQLHEIRKCKQKAKSKQNKIAPIAVIDIPYYNHLVLGFMYTIHINYHFDLNDNFPRT